MVGRDERALREGEALRDGPRFQGEGIVVVHRQRERRLLDVPHRGLDGRDEGSLLLDRLALGRLRLHGDVALLPGRHVRQPEAVVGEGLGVRSGAIHRALCPAIGRHEWRRYTAHRRPGRDERDFTDEAAVGREGRAGLQVRKLADELRDGRGLRQEHDLLDEGRPGHGLEHDRRALPEVQRLRGEEEALAVVLLARDGHADVRAVHREGEVLAVAGLVGDEAHMEAPGLGGLRRDRARGLAGADDVAIHVLGEDVELVAVQVAFPRVDDDVLRVLLEVFEQAEAPGDVHVAAGGQVARADDLVPQALARHGELRQPDAVHVLVRVLRLVKHGEGADGLAVLLLDGQVGAQVEALADDAHAEGLLALLAIGGEGADAAGALAAHQHVLAAHVLPAGGLVVIAIQIDDEAGVVRDVRVGEVHAPQVAIAGDVAQVHADEVEARGVVVLADAVALGLGPVGGDLRERLGEVRVGGQLLLDGVGDAVAVGVGRLAPAGIGKEQGQGEPHQQGSHGHPPQASVGLPSPAASRKPAPHLCDRVRQERGGSVSNEVRTRCAVHDEEGVSHATPRLHTH